MAKEIPYFRFTVQEWQNGKISVESFELQGLFINICGYYWINDCHISMTLLKKRFRNYENQIDELVDLGILKHEKRHDKIEIDFLNIQFDLLSENRKRRQTAGSMGGNAKAMLKQKGSYKDKDKDKENDKDKDNDKDKIKEATPIFKTEFEKVLNEFYNFRQKLKKPIIDASKQKFLQSLSELSNQDESIAIKILNQSIANGWQGIFELKTQTNGKQQLTFESKQDAIARKLNEEQRQIAERLAIAFGQNNT